MATVTFPQHLLCAGPQGTGLMCMSEVNACMVFVLCQALLYVLRNVDGFNPHANPGRERLLLSPFDGWSN